MAGPRRFEPLDVSFDGVALLVSLRIEARWATTGATSPQSVTDLVGGLRNHGNTSPPEMLTDRAG